MKVFSIVMALVIAIFIGGTASAAANWEEIVNNDGTIISIDKDSIKKGTDSKEFPKFNRNDGFSAIVKINMKIKDLDDMETINLVSFYEKNGERMFCVLDSLGGTNYPEKESEIFQEKVDVDGRVWKDVWAYIEKNLK